MVDGPRKPAGSNLIPDSQRTDSQDHARLRLAIQRGHFIAIQTLLEQGINPNDALDQLGNTALHLATSGGNVRLINLLISFDADINVCNRTRRTPLHISLLENQVLAALALIEQNADVSPRDALGWRPLHYASYNNLLVPVKKLLDRGADPNAQALDGATALLALANNENVRPDELIILELLDSGANCMMGLFANDTYPLHWAAHRGLTWLIDLLVSRCPESIDAAQTYRGRTALCVAAQEGHVESVSALLRLGADPNHRCRDSHGLNCSGPLCFALCHENLEVAGILLEAGADPELRNSDGKPILHMVANACARRSISFMLERKVNVLVQDAEGRTAIDHMMSKKDEATATLLRKGLVPPTQTNERDGV
jgi:ankyrin repeat protein